MKTPLHLLCAAFGLFAAVTATMNAQAAKPPATPEPEEIVQMDAFVVQTDADNGKYIAAESITGSRVKAKVLELPFPIQIITNEFMYDFGFDAIDDALSYTSGFVPGEIPSGTTGGRFTRGFSASYRLLDGFMNVSDTGRNFVDRTEIIKGPYAAIYGRSQPGGVVNIVTKKPTRKARQTLRATRGSHDYTSIELSSSGPIMRNTLLYRVDFEYKERGSDLEYWHDRQIAVQPAFEWNPTSDIKISLTGQYLHRDMNNGNFVPYLRPNLPFNATSAQVQSAVRRFAYDLRFFNTGGPLRYYENDTWMITLTAEHRLTANSTLRANLNTTQREMTRYSINGGTYYYIGADGVPNLGSARGDADRYPQIQFNDTHYFAGQIDWLTRWRTKRMQHQFLLTLDAFSVNDPAQVTRLDPNLQTNTAYNLRPLNPWAPQFLAVPYEGNESLYTQRTQDIDNTVVNYGIFGSYRGTMFDNRLIFSLGLRYDWTKSTLRDYLLENATTVPRPPEPVRTLVYRPSSPTYNIGVNYGVIKDALVVFANHSTSFNTQSPRNAAANQGAVENEEGRGVEAGIKSALFDNRINFTLTVYDIHLKNVRVNNPESSINGGPDPDAPQYTLAGRQTSKGIEFDCNFDLGKSLTFFGAVGYVEALIFNAAEYDNNRQRARVPRVNAGAGGRWRAHSGPVKGLSVTGGVSYIGSSRYNNAMPDLVIPGYSVVSAGVGYDFSFNIKRKINNRIQVNINNLLNHQYITNAASGGPRRGIQASYRLDF